MFQELTRKSRAIKNFYFMLQRLSSVDKLLIGKYVDRIPGDVCRLEKKSRKTRECGDKSFKPVLQ